ncbi:MAG: S-layer homology domain-containing protein, partial [Ruminococcaceae bacterium]|nr:S-layer homology domain-containing protein [Oscillospiraceae bacterium]
EETRYCADCDATETREVAPVCPAEKFSDVDTKQWYHEGVCYVIRNGLMNGKSETVFAPNANLTRAELVTVLYRMAGEPNVEDLEHPFTDVADDTWYTDAVIWAYNAEVVKGISETAFAPNANITREQIATILYRYAGAEAVEEDALADFADADKVNNYAVEAMNWAVSVGLINGMDDATLAPQGNATRAQIATILMRYCEG